jgi:hypothetical protein
MDPLTICSLRAIKRLMNLVSKMMISSDFASPLTSEMIWCLCQANGILVNHLPLLQIMMMKTGERRKRANVKPTQGGKVQDPTNHIYHTTKRA